MIEDGSSFKQLVQKLSDGRHEVVGLFVEESGGGTWFERNRVAGLAVVAMGVTVMVSSYYLYTSLPKWGKVVEGMDTKKEKGEKVESEVEDAWDTEKHNLMK